VEAAPFAPAEAVDGTVSFTLDAGDYTLHAGPDGQTHIRMTEDFGFFGAPGEPELPARTFLIALPLGARVTDVHFETPRAVALPGGYRIAPVEPAITGPEDTDRATARWEANREQAYATDRLYPDQVGRYLG
jgi:hypothetical protein